MGTNCVGQILDGDNKPLLTLEQKAAVRTTKHFIVRSYPQPWQQSLYTANWHNSAGQLCGFVELEDADGKYLTTTVF